MSSGIVKANEMNIVIKISAKRRKNPSIATEFFKLHLI